MTVLQVLRDPVWWLSAVVVGILVSVAGNFVTSGLKGGLRKQKALTDLRRAQEEERRALRQKEATMDPEYRHHLEVRYSTLLASAEAGVTRASIGLATVLLAQWIAIGTGFPVGVVQATTFVLFGVCGIYLDTTRVRRDIRDSLSSLSEARLDALDERDRQIETRKPENR